MLPFAGQAEFPERVAIISDFLQVARGNRALVYEAGKILLDQGKSVNFMPEPERFQAYVNFCNRMTARRRNAAQKKIYYWWLPFCHSGESGARLAKQSLDASLDGRLV